MLMSCSCATTTSADSCALVCFNLAFSVFQVVTDRSDASSALTKAGNGQACPESSAYTFAGQNMAFAACHLVHIRVEAEQVLVVKLLVLFGILHSNKFRLACTSVGCMQDITAFTLLGCLRQMLMVVIGGEVERTRRLKLLPYRNKVCR